jgi:small subunit ribosomal protein S13
MVRISGVNLPADKRIVIALTYVYGIGRSLSEQILEDCGIDMNIRTKELTEADEKKIRDRIEKINTEGDLRRKVTVDVKRLQDIGSFRGFRHRRRLPLRGQRTQCNARTRRGRKNAGVGSGKRKDSKK